MVHTGDMEISKKQFDQTQLRESGKEQHHKLMDRIDKEDAEMNFFKKNVKGALSKGVFAGLLGKKPGQGGALSGLAGKLGGAKKDDKSSALSGLSKISSAKAFDHKTINIKNRDIGFFL